MQAADNVEFRGAFGHTLSSALPDFVEREGVGSCRVGRASESAKLAMRDANIGGIDVAVHVEVGDVAVAFLADVIREPAYAQQIVRLIERNAVISRKTFASENFLRHRLEPRVLKRGNRLCVEL